MKKQDTKERFAVLKAQHREETLDSFDTFKNGGEAKRELATPAWRRQAVLDREKRLRAASC